MQLIETVTVGSGGAASITFSAIAADWTDLYIVTSFRTGSRTSGNGGFVYEVLFNGVSANRSSRNLRGSGSSVSSITATEIWLHGGASDDTANTFGNSSIYIPNYTSSSAKSASIDAVNETNGTTAYQLIGAGLWNQTDAITSITLKGLFGDSLVEHSSASLYGILAGSDGITTVS
jgi:hypothetical protein